MNPSLLNRTRLYFNYGGIGFPLILILLHTLGEGLMILMPLAFSLLLWRKLTAGRLKRSGLMVGLISGILTTGVFLIQYNYRQYIDWGCVKRISDHQANVNYIVNMILFSVVIWEMGIWASRKKIEMKM
jgi:hypothetical protein